MSDEPSVFQQDMLDLEVFAGDVPKVCDTRCELYAKYFPKGGVGCELGVLRGVNAENLVRITKPKKLYLVDAWKSGCIPGNPEKRNRFQPKNDKKYRNVCRAFARNKNVVVWRAYTFEAVQALEDESLDWIYIDANHRYAAVLMDIQQWTTKLKIGGYMGCHDFTTLIWNGGVIEAVKYALRRPGDLEVVGKDGERCATIMLRKTRRSGS